MTLFEQTQQALLNFMTSKLRSCLAILGILVGTAAVVALISSGKLATQAALAQFKAMGTNLLAISLYQQSGENNKQGKTHIPLNLWRQFPILTPGVRAIAPYSSTYQSIRFEGHALTGPIIGADESLARIIHINLARGHFVSFLESYEHRCVIGATLAKQLEHLSYGELLSRQIQIGNALYSIVGIAKPWKENAFFNEDINQAIIIPIAGIGLINESSQVNNAIFLLKPSASVDAVIDAIKQIIKKQAPKLSVFARSAKQIIAGMEKQGQIFTLLLTTIGGISLLVGGIGIMNVMLVSVSERKQEIGIRKALGATQYQIQALFLIEAVLLSIVGGISGILLGLFATWIIALINHWPFTLYALPLIVGFIISVSTGIFFGFYPARRAALLDPVVSLRGH